MCETLSVCAAVAGIVKSSAAVLAGAEIGSGSAVGGVEDAAGIASGCVCWVRSCRREEAEVGSATEGDDERRGGCMSQFHREEESRRDSLYT